MEFNRNLFQSCQTIRDTLASFKWPAFGVMITVSLAPPEQLRDIGQFNRAVLLHAGRISKLIQNTYFETTYSKHAYRRGEIHRPHLVIPEMRSRSTGRAVPLHFHAVFSSRDQNEIRQFAMKRHRFRRKLHHTIGRHSTKPPSFASMTIDIRFVRPGTMDSALRYNAKFAFDLLEHVNGFVPVQARDKTAIDGKT